MQFLKNRVVAIATGATILVTLGGVGGAVAVDQITGEDIKNHSVKAVDLDRGAVTMGKLAGSVKQKIKEKAEPGPAGQDGVDGQDGTNGVNGINGVDGKDGATGPQGPAGPQGPQGRPGSDATVGLSHWSVGDTVPAAQNGLPGSIEVVAECQKDGHLAIAGGYTAGTYKGGVTTYQNRNTTGAPGTESYGAGWLVGFTNTTDKPQSVRTWVVCAKVVEDEPSA